MDRAPWDLSIPIEFRKNSHFQRSDSSYICYFPLRIKINGHFNNHQNATEMLKLGLSSPPKNISSSKLHPSHQLLTTLEDIEVEKNTPMPYLKLPNQSYECQLIRMKNISSSATFHIYSDSIIIEYKINPNDKEKQKTIITDDIQAVFLRKYIQGSSAIEIFTLPRKSYFIHFLSVTGKGVIKIIRNLKCPNIELIQTNDFRPFLFPVISLIDGLIDICRTSNT
jgi:hypothetical protein